MSHSIKFLALLILSVLVTVSGFAQQVEGLITFKPKGGTVTYLLPKIKGVKPEVFFRDYIRKLKADAEFGSMENAQKLDLDTRTGPGTFKAVPASTPESPVVATILNRPNQMIVDSPYLPKVVKSFEMEGPRILAVPVGLSTALDEKQMDAFRKLMNPLDGQLGVGGDDVAPQVVGQADEGLTSGDISTKRDREQMAYMEEYMKNGKGRVFYVCGSMQRAAIIEGHAFLCDIGKATKDVHRGETGPKMMEIVAEPESEMSIAAGSTKFSTSNFHHQGVDVKGAASARAQITSFNIEPDGTRGNIVKSIEFENGAGFATQFHPEFRGSPEENHIMHYVATGWKMRGRYLPKEVSACMTKTLDQMLVESASGGSAP